MNLITTKAREAVDPRIVSRFDRLWALVMAVVAIPVAWHGSLALAALTVLFAITVLLQEVNKYHAYRGGYFLGATHHENGMVTDDPHPSDLHKLSGGAA